jgi:cytochrome c556
MVQRSRSFKSAFVAAALCAGLAIAATAHTESPAGGPKPEHYVKYRQSVFNLIRWNFGSMAAVVKGQAAYDSARFATQATRVAALAPMITEGFHPSTKGAKKTEAKDDIFANPAEFNRLAKDLETASANLARVAQSGNLDQIKPAFVATGKACGACHDKFKVDDH